MPGSWLVFVGMFFSLALSGSFGCGYLNPALIFACMIRKENRMHPLTGCLYVFVQFVGAFGGTFIAWAYNDQLTAPFPTVHPTNESAYVTFFREAIGSLVFILSVLIMISSGTTFTTNNFQTWFCVPLCLIAVCKIFNLALGTNPAQALPFQVAYYLFSPNDTPETKQLQLQNIWSVVIGASIGGVLAALIYEFLYKYYVKSYRY